PRATLFPYTTLFRSEAVELLREPLMALLHANHPLAGIEDQGLALAELADEPFVFFPRSYGTGLYPQLFSLARQAGFTPRVGQERSEEHTSELQSREN